MSKQQNNNNLIENTENYSLQNLENYKNLLNFTNTQILQTYAEIIIDFLKFVLENIKTKNINYSKFMIFRGLDTITHVFHHLLYYTKNLPLTTFHTQKSFYFYLEFIEQITQEQHVFLQLSSRDATMYVYKKTIFEINSEAKKLCETTKNEYNDRFFILLETSKIMRLLCTLLIDYEDTIINNNISKFFLYKDNIISEIEYLSFLFNKIYTYDFIDNEKLKHLNRFINIACLSKLNIKNIYEVIYLGFKKILKNDIKSLDKIENFILQGNLNNNNNMNDFCNKFT